MDGVFGYDSAVFLNATKITILTDSQKPIDELTDADVWMSDSPYEYFGMWQLAARASGKVLVGGLGLGLISNILSWRPDVKKLKVVEISQDVINLVRPYVSRRAQIVRDDFISYVHEERDKYDVVIADIWKGTREDRSLFEETKFALEDNQPQALHLFWGYQEEVDEDIVRMFRAEQYYGAKGER
jgi:hypothetical protein